MGCHLVLIDATGVTGRESCITCAYGMIVRYTLLHFDWSKAFGA